MTNRFIIAVFLVWATLMSPHQAHAVRILDVCDIEGVRPNQLTGYGIVVGLNNTGDTGQARFTLQSIAAMLRRLGSTVDPATIQTRNAAAVVVTATLPPNSNPGTRIDVTVSSMGNARSLLGGTLIQTPLRGADARVYAAAQGSVILGGFGASGNSGSSVSVNHLTAGRIPEGGIIERHVDGNDLSVEGPVRLSLRHPSFITAQRIAAAINENLGEGNARAVNAGTVELSVPENFTNDRVGLLAQIQQLDVETEHRARVVIDERTGTVVIGSQVRIREVAIAQGSLTVQIREQPAVSQPNALAGGDTAIVDQTDVEVEVTPGQVHRMAPGASLQDVVNALNALGASPRALIAIFQGLRSAGALEAEVEVH